MNFRTVDEELFVFEVDAVAPDRHHSFDVGLPRIGREPEDNYITTRDGGTIQLSGHKIVANKQGVLHRAGGHSEGLEENDKCQASRAENEPRPKRPPAAFSSL